MSDELLDISSVYVYERAVTAWYLQEVFAKLLEIKYQIAIYTDRFKA